STQSSNQLPLISVWLYLMAGWSRCLGLAKHRLVGYKHTISLKTLHKLLVRLHGKCCYITVTILTGRVQCNHCMRYCAQRCGIMCVTKLSDMKPKASLGSEQNIVGHEN